MKDKILLEKRLKSYLKRNNDKKALLKCRAFFIGIYIKTKYLICKILLLTRLFVKLKITLYIMMKYFNDSFVRFVMNEQL